MFNRKLFMPVVPEDSQLIVRLPHDLKDKTEAAWNSLAVPKVALRWKRWLCVSTGEYRNWRI